MNVFERKCAMLMSEYPVVSVHIPPNLRPLAEGRDEIMASGETVGEILEAVGHEYPALGESLFCADGSLADGFAVFGVAVVEQHLRAIAARGLDLGGRRILRHHDHGGHAEDAG